MTVLPRHHAYKDFEGTPLWKTIDAAITRLVENGDIEELTAREFIVGYLCKVYAAATDSDAASTSE